MYYRPISLDYPTIDTAELQLYIKSDKQKINKNSLIIKLDNRS